MITQIKFELKKYARPDKVAIFQNFFKTGKGQYGEGDVFIGVNVPDTRLVAKKYKDAPLSVVEKLFKSKIHEERLLGVFILVQKYEKINNDTIVEFYLKHNQKINNWDLVDMSAPNIVGHYYFNKNRSPLRRLAKSDNLWERRTAIIATFYFIRRGQFDETLAIAQILLNDKHDLIHKAVGWMLREVGNRERKVEEEFLIKHYRKMPRTMLRYAIEKFEEPLRLKYLKGIV